LWELILKAPKAGALIADPVRWWEKYVVGSDLHRDPFDRILVAQSIAEGLTLLSKDVILGRYGVPVIW
jgi:PIN domain nuclease of toxin-antitoxin system